jgi:hypothetical protein
MRNLTITRRKSFVGCAMKDKVYIRDVLAQEITINGVPCRKIGEIKNGETKTFQIDDGEQQVFLIADKVSKDYCNAAVTIPEGQEDVSLSGVHRFVFGSNPFRFDGVQQSEEELAKQKRNGRKGMVIMIAAIILGTVVGFLLTSGLFKDSPKTFTKGEFQITLTDAFEPAEQAGYFTFYSSKNALVFTLREAKTFFDDITLKEYGELVLKANGKTGMQMKQGDGFLWFDYTATPEDEEIYYIAVCCESEDAFWIVNFATPVSNRDKYKETFLDWARSIEID